MNTAQPPPFLTAEWRHLAIVNFEVDPNVLEPLVPVGTELDYWNGRAFISLVGFLFLRTRVIGAAIPCHQDFEEVNLRFYVRRQASDGWRRAVVFIKEIVPRRAIALTARALYGERYVALPMEHCIEEDNGGPCRVSYSWWLRGKENRISLSVSAEPCDIEEATWSSSPSTTGAMRAVAAATQRSTESNIRGGVFGLPQIVKLIATSLRSTAINSSNPCDVAPRRPFWPRDPRSQYSEACAAPERRHDGTTRLSIVRRLLRVLSPVDSILGRYSAQARTGDCVVASRLGRAATQCFGRGLAIRPASTAS